jgi:CBS domain-containing protein
VIKVYSYAIIKYNWDDVMPYCPNCGKLVLEDAKYCIACGTYLGKITSEEFSVSGEDLIRKVNELIHEGNIRRIIVKNEKGENLVEMPATVGVVGAILVPWMAALGVIATLATKCTIIVERKVE